MFPVFRASCLTAVVGVLSTVAGCAGDVMTAKGTQAASVVDLVITNGHVVTMNAEGRVFSPGAIAIRGTSIVDVGTAERIAREYQARDSIDARDRVIMP